jgi:hypothetical protein
MKIIFADMTNYKNPVYCKECAKNHPGLTKISLIEAKGMIPNAEVLCSDCNKNLEIEE